MAEDEVLIEVEAAKSVYGDDCLVLAQYPPHLNLLIKPRTADDSSQQFVEAVIGIRASSKVYQASKYSVNIVLPALLDEIVQ
ncbi:hypothetical protein E3N88_43297 [Mikania micrantha]|uniref:RWD domain-containing protein n=1 Tax=Mikania micrantha TaxID=192012 RepID=A0A5N6LFH0_9ASTR|nr:hypothetical protein E3N88_43297 [Mikania micrantha]